MDIIIIVLSSKLIEQNRKLNWMKGYYINKKH